jgi:WD40 repeat protein/DNA-binding SARP family transcriptional activator
VVIAVLLAAGGRAVSVDTLLQALYGEDADPSRRASLHTYISNLRNVLGEVIVRQGDGYVLDTSGSTVDAAAFEDGYRSATGRAAPADAATGLREALALWRGHPYADVDAHGVLDGEVTRLSELRLAAMEARLDADLATGRHREVVGELEALTVEYPYREHLRALHMLALYRSGRQAEALRAFGRTRDTLVEDLGVDPSPELRELERRILVHDRELLEGIGPSVQRRAVLVADIDDAGWVDPVQREVAFAERETLLAAAARSDGGLKLAPKGTAGYAVFAEPIHAIRAAEAVANERTRVAIDVGDLELVDEEPAGPPLARAARLVAVAHPGQVILSSAAHEALTGSGEAGWAAEALGRFDIVGLDPGIQLYQLVGNGFRGRFPALCTDRLPPPVPDGAARSVPGYELRALIGDGQLGEVHRAYQPSVGREVAVRIFGPGIVGHPQFVRRFETAAQRITRVEHPRVVPLMDYWREPTRAVMVSRLMTGGDLTDRIPANGMEAAPALALFETVALGVASAHRHGVVHGRIRPENVLFDEEDNAYVADVGVDEICAGIVTFATDAYDAPERLGGNLATVAADIYSLGVLAHQLLSGSAPPLDGPLAVGDDAFGRVISKATEPDPSRRHGSVAELLSDLGDALAVPVGPTAAFVAARNPYRGLESFERADAADFHGRDLAIAEMVALLEREPLLLVVGPSGVGKSSVVNAGVVPSLAGGAIAGSDRWLVTAMAPGRNPFDQLAAVLGHVANVAVPDIASELTTASTALADIVGRLVPDNTPVVIVIDQLEELFTHTVDETERRAFLQMLVEHAARPVTDVRIVATLRADFFDRPLSYPGFGDAVRGRTFALGAMSPEDIADAVRLPAAAVGVQVEPALVERIATESTQQPGALPLVQHTMAELFEERETNVITLAAFDEMGGLAGSVGRRAEAIFAALDERARDDTRRVFIRLVTVSDNHDDTRRRVRRTELERLGIGSDDLDKVLTEFGRHRLLTFDRDSTTRTPTVELAHEALISEWDRYRHWIDDAREDLLTQRRVETAAHDWVDAGSDASFLYTGGRLELTEAWAGSSAVTLSDAEQRFLHASRIKANRDRTARTRRRRLVTGVLVSALFAATTMAGLAFSQRRDADARANESEARRTAARALIETPYDRALLLAVEATRLWDSPETRGNVLTTIERSRQVTGVIHSGGPRLLDVAVSPDGTHAAVVDHRDAITLYDLSHRRAIATLAAQGIGYRTPAFSPDGNRLAVTSFPTRCWMGEACDQSGIEVYDAHDLHPLNLRYEGLGLAAVDLQYSPSGEMIAAVPPLPFAEPDGNVSIWRVDEPDRPIARFTVDPGEIRNPTVDSLPPGWLSFSPDSSRLYAGGAGPTLEFDLDSEQRVQTFEGDGALALSPDGRSIAVLDSPTRVSLFDTPDGRRRAELIGHDGLVTAAAFSPDGERVATVSNDESVMIWDAATGKRLAVLDGHDGSVLGVAFSADGRSLYTAAADGSLIMWDTDGAGGAARRVVGASSTTSLGVELWISPTADSVVMVDSDWTTLRVTSLAGGQPAETEAIDWAWVAYSPDGTRFAVVSDTGALSLFDAVDGSLLASTPGREIGNFGAVAFSADGSTVLVADRDGIVTEHDGRTLEPTGRSLDVGVEPAAIRTAADGLVAVVSLSADRDDGTEIVFGDFDEDDIVRRVEVPVPLARTNFSPDGRYFAVGGYDGRLIVVDVASGRFVGPEDPVHSGPIAWVTFSPDGETLASLGFDGELVLLNASTAAVHARARPGPGNVHATVGFHPDGESVLIAYADGSVIRFATDSSAWIDHACRVAGRNLTEAEWRDAFGDRPYRETCPTTR